MGQAVQLEAVVLVLGAPLLVPVAYGVAAAAGWAVGGARGIAVVNRQGFVVYATFVAALAWLVWAAGVPAASVERWLSLDTSGLAAVGLLLGAAAAGGLLFALDYGAAKATRRWGGARTQAVLEGATRAAAGRRPSSISGFSLTFVIVVAEEFLWRGVLIDGSQAAWGLATGEAIALSAVAFGTYHYFFGVRNVVVKTIHGAVWAGAFVLTGSLLVPLVSHLTFNLLAFALSVPRARRRELRPA